MRSASPGRARSTSSSPHQAHPASAENACYFYNRSQKGTARFVSYHFDQEAEIVEEVEALKVALAEANG